MNKMESLVNECLVQHEGGEKFFDAIDDKLRSDKVLMTMMIGKILENEHFDFLITSGTFGKFFKNYCENHMDKEFSNQIIVVNGSLRNENEKIIDFWNQYDISDKSIIFVDDSYYLGRTRNKIKNAIEKHHGKFINTYVFYDGSKEKDKSVHSFYRYYDYHNIIN